MTNSDQFDNNLQNDIVSKKEKFDELHFFLDESGQFTEKSDINLVGGVLLFGLYDGKVQNGIRRAITNALKKINGQYPQDLHFYAFRESAEEMRQAKEQKKLLCNSLHHELENWRKQENVKIYGILIRHRQDIYSETSGILNEKEVDNRYIAMLWSLIEHSVFVNKKVISRLNDNAKIHLHIANRMFVFPKDEAKREYLQSLGWQVSDDTRGEDNQYAVTTIINEDELRGMFRVALSDRWQMSKLELGEVDIQRLRYNNVRRETESTTALYLADLLLGVERSRIIRYNQIIVQPTLPILEQLDYSPHLKFITNCKSQLLSGGIESVLSNLEDNPIDPNDSGTDDLIPLLVEYYTHSPKTFHRLFMKASQFVDQPNYRQQGLDILKLLEFVYQKTGQRDLLSELYSILIPFSVANHSGDTEAANELWERYLELENQLPALGNEAGLTMQAEFRCRRAVSLTDQFQFEKAEQILVDIGTKAEQFQEKMAEIFETTVEQLNRRPLGMCYSTLAQACAFQANDFDKRTLAESLFRNALNCFTEPDDQERIWVYLAHLACDFPEELRSLWEEAHVNFLQYTGNIIDGIEKPFVLAAYIKGMYVFGNINEKRQWANDLNQILVDYSNDLLNRHPFGLILQMTAMLNVSVFNETGESEYKKNANVFFSKAVQSLASGEKLLKTLASAAQLRSVLFALETDANNAGKLELLQNTIRSVAKKLSIVPTSDNPIEQANQLLSNIRFNYW
ncbi:MAG: hypothetical protein LBQ66_05775 [Planctomycetaceae bacterium]|jgi:hypothetical protein|nr:hypothetical protein [Planctomycetaceae bacterium]